MHSAAPLVVLVFSLAVLGSSEGGEGKHVSVSVKDDGMTCIVQGREMTCSRVAEFLTKDLGVPANEAISVSPEGCGSRAISSAGAVANMLRAAKFSDVFLIGFLTEPNRQCAP